MPPSSLSLYSGLTRSDPVNTERQAGCGVTWCPKKRAVSLSGTASRAHSHINSPVDARFLKLPTKALLLRMMWMVRIIPGLKSMVDLSCLQGHLSYGMEYRYCLWFCFAVYMTMRAAEERRDKFLSVETRGAITEYRGSIGQSITPRSESTCGGQDGMVMIGPLVQETYQVHNIVFTMCVAL